MSTVQATDYPTRSMLVQDLDAAELPPGKKNETISGNIFLGLPVWRSAQG
jgi:hypothetical protein